MSKNILNDKKGGIIEIWIFIGVVVIIASIFLASFALQKAKDMQVNDVVNSKLDRIDKEIMLLTYLRTDFMPGMNFADYITTSNLYLRNPAKYGGLFPDYKPEYFDEFKEKTVDYFDDTLTYGKKSWYMMITPVHGRDLSSLTTTGRYDVHRDENNLVYIIPYEKNLRTLLRRTTGVLGTQILPSPEGRIFVLQLFEVSFLTEDNEDA